MRTKPEQKPSDVNTRHAHREGVWPSSESTPWEDSVVVGRAQDDAELGVGRSLRGGAGGI